MQKLWVMYRKYLAVVMLLGVTYFAIWYILSVIGVAGVPWQITGVMFMTMVLADHVLTRKAISIGGRERNPVANWLFRKLGVRRASSGMIFGAALFVFFFWKNVPPAAQYAMIAAYFLVPVNNFLVLRRIRNKRNNLRRIERTSQSAGELPRSGGK